MADRVTRGVRLMPYQPATAANRLAIRKGDSADGKRRAIVAESPWNVKVDQTGRLLSEQTQEELVQRATEWHGFEGDIVIVLLFLVGRHEGFLRRGSGRRQSPEE